MEINRPITIVLTLFVIIFLVFFLVVPGYKTFVKLQADLGEKKAEYNAEFDYYNTIDATYADLQIHQDDIKKIDDALPEESALGKVVYFLQESAKESGMMVKDLFLSKSTSSADASSISSVKDLVFSVNLIGDYVSLGKYISSLEKSARIFEVTNISFGSPAASALVMEQSQFAIQQTYNFNLQIKTHSY